MPGRRESSWPGCLLAVTVDDQGTRCPHAWLGLRARVGRPPAILASFGPSRGWAMLPHPLPFLARALTVIVCHRRATSMILKRRRHEAHLTRVPFRQALVSGALGCAALATTGEARAGTTCSSLPGTIIYGAGG